MAISKVIWEGAPVITANILTTALNALANNVMSGPSSEIDNTADLNTYGWLELNVTFTVAPSDSAPHIYVYTAKTADGINYESPPLTGAVDQSHMFFEAIPVQKVTSAQRIIVGPIAIPPFKYKFYLDNQTGQALAATGNTLDYIINNLEGQ